jgi:hypothetical protein
MAILCSFNESIFWSVECYVEELIVGTIAVILKVYLQY